jgi:hypothetical protein
MKAIVKVQISKEYMIEEEELREVREKLESIFEGCKALECGQSESDDDDDEMNESF